MARKAFTEHPDFLRVSHTASEAIVSAAEGLGIKSILEGGSEFDIRANTIADDLTRLLLACLDKRTSKAA